MRLLPLLLLLATPLSAADLHVAPGGSIQAAIDLAADGDRVLVEPGTYVEHLDYLGKAIHVLGVGGAQQTTLDGGGSGPVVRFATLEGTASRLQGFTVRGGYASFGAGGLACAAGSTPTIEDCIVRNNSGKFGGGVSGSPVMRRCAIVDNTASLTHGGGIYGAPDLAYCVVASNTATSADGGGLYLVGGNASVVDCIVVENSAVFAGSHAGGIHVDSTATAVIERTVIAYNFSTGGVFAGYGGGVRVEAAGTTALDRCVITGNSVSGSSTYGAGLYGPASITNSIVRGNLGGPQISNASLVTWSDVEGGYPGVGNFDLEPFFVDGAQRDYHLLPTSLLIDAGDPLAADPDGTRADVGAFPFQTLYTRANTLTADWEQPGWPEISVEVGGRQVLESLVGASSAGSVYLTAGSASGTQPGFDLLGAHVPLNPDAWFDFTLQYANSGLLETSLGLLDAEGRGRTTIVLPALPSSGLAGLSLDHATLADQVGPDLVLTATNAVTLTLVP